MSSTRTSAAATESRKLSDARAQRLRRRAGLVSLVVALVLLFAKFQAYRITGSTAVLSDALESIVNVVASIFALGGLLFAGAPADRNHPYGHGKIEFVAAAFEGGLIVFAALLIVWEACQAMVTGVEVKDLDVGLWITVGAGVANALLGWFLISVGRRTRSLTLVADGQHVLADFWTSVGVVTGLGLVAYTGVEWFDPVAAIVVALYLLWTGGRLLRTAAGGLLDEEDAELVDRLVAELGTHLGQGVIRVHHLRAIRAGRFHHVSAHLVVPEFWTVERSHTLSERLAQQVMTKLGVEGELVFHTDPCHRAYCRMCDVEPCAVRAAEFVERPPLRVEEAVRPDPPRQPEV